MKDEDRIEQTMDQAGVGYDTVLRQGLKQLAKAIREDERSECETIARRNESRKSVEEIGKRRYGS